MMLARRLTPTPMTLTIAALTGAGVLLAFGTEGYSHFILSLVALTAVVGVGLNVLLGLSGQVSLGHVGFYAIGAYTAAILTVNGVSFWVAFLLAGLLTGVIGALLALPALRASGPYLAMITIAFAFIVQHGTIEWKTLTGGQNGLMGLVPPTLAGHPFGEREMAIFATVLAGLSFFIFQRLAASAWIDRDGEVEALLKRFPRLRERLSSRAGFLSGGEQQLLAIARGLMAKPRILLLDEPSLGLAPAMINELFDVLATLRDDGVTILLVDQMAALALTVADRGYVLESGRIVRDDAAEALAHDPALEAAYLGHGEAAQ